MKRESINSLRALRAQVRREQDDLRHMAGRLTEMLDLITEVLEEECDEE